MSELFSVDNKKSTRAGPQVLDFTFLAGVMSVSGQPGRPFVVRTLTASHDVLGKCGLSDLR